MGLANLRVPNLRVSNLRVRIYGSCGASISEGAGGARRDRTADLLNAIQALSQLSYGPVRQIYRHSWCRHLFEYY